MKEKESLKILDARLLVCGGAGFIGSNFIRHILNKHKKATIVNFDKLTYSGNIDNLKDISRDKRYKFFHGDITDKKYLSVIFNKFKPEYIINFAAETHVDRSIHQGIEEFVNTNILGVLNILEAVKNNPKVKKYVQVSTDEVYGSLDLNSKNKFSENTALAPNAPYAATKVGGDMLCRAYYKTFKIPTIVTHCSNNYGPYQYPEKLIPFFVSRMMENKKLPIYGDGKNVRDWIYVLDHCEALELCLFDGKPGEVYNIGADNEINNLEIARLILSFFKKDNSWIEFIVDRPGHDRRYSIDSSKIRKELNWRPKYNFKKSFNETMQWYLYNKKWMDDVRQNSGILNPHIL